MLRLSEISVKEYMARDLLTFSVDTDIQYAISQLVARRLSGAPVVNGLGELIGMLSEKDCLKVALNAVYHEEPGGKVGDFMTVTVETVEAGTSIIEVAEKFVAMPFKRFPVVDAGKLVGQISRSDVVRAIDHLSMPVTRAA